MKIANLNKVKRRLDAILEDVGDSKAQIKIERRGQVWAAIVPIEDIELVHGLKSDLNAEQSHQYREPIRKPDDSQDPGVVSAEANAERDSSEALGTSEQRYRELFDDSPVAIWVEDWSRIKRMLDGLLCDGVENWNTYFNRHQDQLKQAYGLADIVEISQAAIALFHEDSLEDLLSHTAPSEVIAEELDAFLDMMISFWNGSFSLDVESKDIDGAREEIMLRRRIVIPPAHQADWSRIIYALEDITERVRLEEQLRQAQKMEMVGQLTGGVAHDFNNLLAIIQGNAQLLANAVGTGNKHLEPILRATERGGELTQRLLAFSRTQPLQPRPMDLGALVSGMSNILTRTLGETINIELRTTSRLWNALADPGQLENALLNLTLNARDAMQGGGVLTIECSNVHLDEAGAAADADLSAGDYVLLTVSDTGQGMTTEVLTHAFEPFFTTKEVGTGSGLGLSMVYGFAKQSGGHVNITSEPGRGTTVKLYLQRAGSEEAETEQVQQGRGDRGKGESVLLIEDDADVRSLTLQMLEHLGYRVTDVPDAAAAHDVLTKGTRFDLVLSDVVLPGGTSGPEFAEQAIANQPELKVLFMSGYPAQAVIGAGFMGAERVLLSKPFQMEQLAKALRNVLD